MMTRFGAILLALLGLFWWRVGCEWLEKMAPIGELAELRCEIPLAAFDYDMMERAELRAKSNLSFVLWDQLDNRKISSPIGRSVQADVVLVRGEERLLFSAALAPEDIEGALIDRETAQALFGDENVMGAQMHCLGRTRTIRGVLDIPGPTVVLAADSLDKTLLHNVTISDGTQTEAFSLRHGLNAVTVYGRSWLEAAGFVCALPAVFGCAYLLLSLIGVAWHCRSYPARYVLAVFCLLIFGTFCIFWLLAVLPDRWTPPRWSDFHFWSEAAKAWQQEQLALFTMKKYCPEMAALAGAAKAAAKALQSLGALLAAAFLKRKLISY